MTIESTNDNIPTTPAITYSECYQQCFCSDNLELMKNIESNTIDLIYCDILYGTGRKFADYQDLKPIRSEIEQHYIPRIKEMHRILKPTGSIYLQMDTRINHWMRCIMDDVFGYDRFLNEIIWDKGFRGTEQKTKYQNSHDHILFYCKDSFIWNDVFCEYADKNMKRYNKKDDNGNIYAEIKRKRSNGEIYYGKCYPKIKGKKADDVIRDIKTFASTSNERNGYDTQKPKALIERIIKASSNEGDLVADFYLGSGTTAEVCKDLNRNFIGCDINPRAVEITLQRLNNARS